MQHLLQGATAIVAGLGAAAQGFQQAFTALAMQVFMGEPNDLVVHTASALEIDPGARMFSADQQYRATTDHSSYFQDAGVQEFIRRHFAG